MSWLVTAAVAHHRAGVLPPGAEDVQRAVAAVVQAVEVEVAGGAGAVGVGVGAGGAGPVAEVGPGAAVVLGEGGLAVAGDAGAVAELEFARRGDNELGVGEGRGERDTVEAGLYGAELGGGPGVRGGAADESGDGLDVVVAAAVRVHHQVEPAVAGRYARRYHVVRVVGAEGVADGDLRPGGAAQGAAGDSGVTVGGVPDGVLVAACGDQAVLEGVVVDQAVVRDEVQGRGVQHGGGDLGGGRAGGSGGPSCGGSSDGEGDGAADGAAQQVSAVRRAR